VAEDLVIEVAARDAFRLTADPAFFWRHGQYGRAFDTLRAAVLGGERFAVLTGDAGTGKTTLSNALGQSLRDDGVFVGRLIYGRIEAAEMWTAVAHAVTLDGTESGETFMTLGAGVRAVLLIVDEAHTLSPAALVELERVARVLSPADRPVLSVLLVGLPELSAHLASVECAGLGERIGTWVEVADLSAAEVASYIRHRLTIASANPELLSADVVGRIATASGGTPARINEMCHALLAGFDGMPEPLTVPHSRLAARWLDRRRWPATRIGLVVAAVAGLGITILAGAHHRNAAPPPGAVLAPTEPVPASVDATSLRAVGRRVPSPAPPQHSSAASAARVKDASTPSETQRAVTKPRRQDDQPDASDVIDWLLKEGARRR
jgi:general secretion pathway protein A